MQRIVGWVMTLAMIGFLSAAVQAQTLDNVRQSVVKVHTTVRMPDLARPWAKQAPQKASGSGLVIEGKRILTNAHVVSYASEVYVQGYQDADRIEARVVAVAPGMDLAVLELDDESFFENRPALPLADDLPRVRDSVDAYGYPTGGEDLSVTNGIISRIEIAGYNHGVIGLRIQVDAALNPGNSGGPAIADGKVAGVVFSGVPSADNIGYLIPTEEIKTFLADIDDGDYDGKVRLYDELQTIENQALRDKLGLTREITGMMVTRIRTGADEETYPLKPWDVITHIGEHSIDNDGHVRIREDLRVRFNYWAPKLAKDGQVGLTVFRAGQNVEVQAPVQVDLDYVMPPLDNDYPRYFIYGPLVFSQITREHAQAASRYQAMLSQTASPLLTRMTDTAQTEGEEMVAVFSPLFPHRIAKGYDSPYFAIVEKVNHVKINNLAHLVEVLRDSKEEFVVFEFAGRQYETIVFKHKDAINATEEILTDNGIRYQHSGDLEAVWKKK